MAAADPRIRQIKIKTGVLKRSEKELRSYQKEVIAEETKLEKMKADNRDPHDVKKQGEVLAESRMMIPDCKKRTNKAHGELQNLIESEAELKEAEEYQAAQKLLSEIDLDNLD